MSPVTERIWLKMSGMSEDYKGDHPDASNITDDFNQEIENIVR